MTNKLDNLSKSTDFYCSQKFWWLSVDLEKSKTMSCCSATPAKINFDYINQYPGNLFNSPEMISERQQMLSNQPVASCSSACWLPESKSQISRRISMKSYLPTHVEPITQPEKLQIIVGSDCNMTCIYCCKYYSSAWARDINDNGDYPINTGDDRFILKDMDRVIMKLSQKDIKSTRFNDILLNEISCLVESSTLKEISIIGGEPLLYLDLVPLIAKLSGYGIPIKISSGLGVNTERFNKEIQKLRNYENIQVLVSAESTGQMYELLRNGNTWYRFEKNIEVLQQQGMPFQFVCTVTNLALLGIDDFIDYAQDVNIIWNTCTDPDFFAVHVLDEDTKMTLADKVNDYPQSLQEIIRTVSNSAMPVVKDKLSKYLQEFTQRRSIDLGFLPLHFRSWLAQS